MTGKISGTRHLDLRRCLKMAAAALGLALPARAGAAPSIHRWAGIALGAPAELIVRHVDPTRTAGPMEAAIVELRRLERIFSLFDPASALVRLNRTDRLSAPPFELVDLLDQAEIVHFATGGAFDPAVQPLWRLHADAAAAGRAPEPNERRPMEPGHRHAPACHHC